MAWRYVTALCYAATLRRHRPLADTQLRRADVAARLRHAFPAVMAGHNRTMNGERDFRRRALLL